MPVDLHGKRGRSIGLQGIGIRSADDLDQLHPRYRVEEMDTNQATAVLHGVADIFQWNARGVCGDQGIRPRPTFDLLKQADASLFGLSQ